MEKSKITTLKELKKINYQPRSIQEELAKNLREKIKKGETTFEGLIGYENTVIPDLERAIPVSYTHLTLPTNREV